VTIAPLADLDPGAVDMLSVLIIGSSRTRALAGPYGRSWAYTPRGYSLKP
jgi:cobalt-precorrin 5A hydrolase/precorrin-3B C17-methyltransferase